MNEVYKLLQDQGKYDSDDVSDIVKLHKDSDTREGTRGQSLKLFIEHACTNVRKESFSLRVTRSWNELPEVVVTATSVNSFKNRLDRHWIWRNHVDLGPRRSRPVDLGPRRSRPTSISAHLFSC